MVCSPHIGVLAGIAGGYAPPRYNFDPVKTSRYQKSSLYDFQINSNSLYNFQNTSNDDLLSRTPQKFPVTQQNKIFGVSEQSHLPVSEAIAYQSLLLTALSHAYATVIEEVQKTSAKNQLQRLIEKELEALQIEAFQMHRHSQTPQQVQTQGQNQLYN